MNAANIETFLDALFMDSEDAGTPVPERPGYVEYPERALSPEDRQVRVYTEDCQENPMALDPSEHAAAYDISMITLLHLRRGWKETTDWYMGKTPEWIAASMAADVLKVIDHLKIVEMGLQRLALGEVELSRLAKEVEAGAQRAALTAAAAIADAAVHKRKYNSSCRTLDLIRILSEGPVEQLARVGNDSTTKEGA